MTEIWKPIAGFEKYYKISSKGRVMSLCKRSGCHGRIEEWKREKILTPTDNGNGYLVVSLKTDAKHRKAKYVHRLVADAFLPNPNGLEQVNHIDFNKKNNSVENLEWCSRLQNVAHSVCNMRKPKTYKIETNSGEKYIYHTKYSTYRVAVTNHGQKTFKTLEEAISYRNEVMNDDEYYARREQGA